MVNSHRHPAMLREVSLFQRLNYMFVAQFTLQFKTRHYILFCYITLWTGFSDLPRCITLHHFVFAITIISWRVCGVSRSIPTFRLHCPPPFATHLLPWLLTLQLSGGNSNFSRVLLFSSVYFGCVSDHLIGRSNIWAGSKISSFVWVREIIKGVTENPLKVSVEDGKIPITWKLVKLSLLSWYFNLQPVLGMTT